MPYGNDAYSPSEYARGESEAKYYSDISKDTMLGDIETDVITVRYDEKNVENDLAGKMVNTKIISASFGDRSPKEHVPLKEPVIYTLEHRTVSKQFVSLVGRVR